jgi:hypothetical protein
MWDYQVELSPNQTKNIWVIDGTYTVASAFKSVITLVNEGEFPPTSQTRTPTPTATPTPTTTPTPSVTATNTPTPSVTTTGTETPTPTPTNTQTPTNTPTETPTDTPSVTPTQTPTNTPSQTPTDTPSVTPTPTPTSPLQSFSVYSAITSNEACENGDLVTIYAFDPQFDENSQFYNVSTGIVTTDMAGFYSDGTSVTEINSTGAVIGTFTLCSVVPTPTPTPTQTSTSTPTPTVTQTPTQTFAWYTYSLGTGSTFTDACLAFSASPQTIYGSIAGGVGPNVGEFLYETTGRPLTDVVPNGFYSNGTAWYQVTGGLGQITASDPNGCL